MSMKTASASTASSFPEYCEVYPKFNEGLGVPILMTPMHSSACMEAHKSLQATLSGHNLTSATCVVGTSRVWKIWLLTFDKPRRCHTSSVHHWLCVCHYLALLRLSIRGFCQGSCRQCLFEWPHQGAVTGIRAAMEGSMVDMKHLMQDTLHGRPVAWASSASGWQASCGVSMAVGSPGALYFL